MITTKFPFASCHSHFPFFSAKRSLLFSSKYHCLKVEKSPIPFSSTNYFCNHCYTHTTYWASSCSLKREAKSHFFYSYICNQSLKWKSWRNNRYYNTCITRQFKDISNIFHHSKLHSSLNKTVKLFINQTLNHNWLAAPKPVHQDLNNSLIVLKTVTQKILFLHYRHWFWRVWKDQNIYVSWYTHVTT